MINTTYVHPHIELADAIEFLEANTIFRVKGMPVRKINSSVKHEIVKYVDAGKFEPFDFMSDGQLLRFAKEKGFGKFQKIDLEKIINEEALKCASLECDGSVRVIHYALDNHHIPHYVFQGTLELDGKIIPLHYWIGLPDGRLVDFKARMWLGDDAPNGIFYPKDTRVIYEGKPVELPMTELLYKLLTEVV